jgi:hypothetical protein
MVAGLMPAANGLSIKYGISVLPKCGTRAPIGRLPVPCGSQPKRTWTAEHTYVPILKLFVYSGAIHLEATAGFENRGWRMISGTPPHVLLEWAA